MDTSLNALQNSNLRIEDSVQALPDISHWLTLINEKAWMTIPVSNVRGLSREIVLTPWFCIVRPDVEVTIFRFRCARDFKSVKWGSGAWEFKKTDFVACFRIEGGNASMAFWFCVPWKFVWSEESWHVCCTDLQYSTIGKIHGFVWELNRKSGKSESQCTMFHPEVHRLELKDSMNLKTDNSALQRKLY